MIGRRLNETVAGLVKNLSIDIPHDDRTNDDPFWDDKSIYVLHSYHRLDCVVSSLPSEPVSEEILFRHVLRTILKLD